MEDRELLELAAKASGIHDLKYWGAPCIPAAWIYDYQDAYTYKTWHPLTDDGDNRRLQVRLRLGLVPLEGGGWDCYSYTDAGEKMLATDMDPNRAVVLAAAAIGKEM
ncbi:hypothetical protein [Achromobacter ruhlandii]|uniref:Phage ABA sandwich domain-containing protein n=2 Tax=Achromobacter ruhlandii TaxID=72557 RepID=A0ABM8M4K2_9BURK|nr:hypothetical protein [Achromobacter ruhlandii]AKP88981.1 hypothetical protein Axylo_1461 [Achromobacter xylosoxidans]MCZ8432221.1 hypothetical protein [Achromobacter ruhlandii]MDC6087004.1 hypothetical protein [Achromobacter ruhlandii]MDC6154245.1 hypothetical protein [Achromobacter ruhlandii]MDD7979586.1 hypothetical protein [Achromobacter ruhlandii]